MSAALESILYIASACYSSPTLGHAWRQERMAGKERKLFMSSKRQSRLPVLLTWQMHACVPQDHASRFMHANNGHGRDQPLFAGTTV